jgi:hypothetical protein
VRGDACPSLLLDLNAFQEGSVIGEASRLYGRENSRMEIVVKAFDISQFDAGEIESEIGNLSNLRHPGIATPIGFALALAEGELKIARKHFAGGSLAEAVSGDPA